MKNKIINNNLERITKLIYKELIEGYEPDEEFIMCLWTLLEDSLINIFSQTKYESEKLARFRNKIAISEYSDVFNAWSLKHAIRRAEELFIEGQKAVADPNYRESLDPNSFVESPNKLGLNIESRSFVSLIHIFEGYLMHTFPTLDKDDFIHALKDYAILSKNMRILYLYSVCGWLKDKHFINLGIEKFV